MMTVASPLMGKKLAKLAYLLLALNRVDSPLPNGVSVEMMRAPARSRRYVPAKTGHFATRADRKSERFRHDMALSCLNDVFADEVR
jgi:hypothetical protein